MISPRALSGCVLALFVVLSLSSSHRSSVSAVPSTGISNTCLRFFNDSAQPAGIPGLPFAAVDPSDYCSRYNPGCCSGPFGNELRKRFADIPQTEDCSLAFRRLLCMMCDTFYGFFTIDQNRGKYYFSVCTETVKYVDDLCRADPVVGRFTSLPYGVTEYVGTLLSGFSDGLYEFRYGVSCPCYNCDCFYVGATSPPYCPYGCDPRGNCNPSPTPVQMMLH
eukprot:TRINITY_DN1866_c0_g1_i1.p1 TRINITY_DN1866_c0_g1~~TRINITY_DN1866_c0_g1_i1.p1  ORF type:complete len:221 (-),score=32.23 TRINITY_DN1866_c0_g1_i1:401-1063(-)